MGIYSPVQWLHYIDMIPEEVKKALALITFMKLGYLVFWRWYISIDFGYHNWSHFIPLAHVMGVDVSSKFKTMVVDLLWSLISLVCELDITLCHTSPANGSAIVIKWLTLWNMVGVCSDMRDIPTSLIGAFLLQLWWHHDLEVLSQLLVLCEGNLLVVIAMLEKDIFKYASWEQQVFHYFHRYRK